MFVFSHLVVVTRETAIGLKLFIPFRNPLLSRHISPSLRLFNFTGTRYDLVTVWISIQLMNLFTDRAVDKMHVLQAEFELAGKSNMGIRRIDAGFG